MIEINRHPSRRELMWFGAIFALFFGVVGAIVLWRSGSMNAAGVIWGIAAAVAIVFYALPPVRRPIYLGWMYAAFPIGWTISHLMLAAIFYLLFTPIGLVMRLLGHDPVQRTSDPDAATYWQPHRPADDPERYFKQY